MSLYSLRRESAIPAFSQRFDYSELGDSASTASMVGCSCYQLSHIRDNLAGKIGSLARYFHSTMRNAGEEQEIVPWAQGIALEALWSLLPLTFALSYSCVHILALAIMWVLCLALLCSNLHSVFDVMSALPPTTSFYLYIRSITCKSRQNL